MPFQNLPNVRPAEGQQTDPGNLTGEAAKYYELYNKVLRSTSGTYSFTSTSSNLIYSTDDYPLDSDVYDRGEDGMIAYLKKYILNSYIMDSTNMTLLSNTVDGLSTDVGHAANGSTAATGLHAAINTNTTNISTLQTTTNTISNNFEKSFPIILYIESGSWVQVSGTETYYQIITQQVESYAPDVSQYTKIDIQPNETVLAQLINDGVGAMFAKNESTVGSNVFKVYSVGACPQVRLDMQATRTEVLPASQVQ